MGCLIVLCGLPLWHIAEGEVVMSTPPELTIGVTGDYPPLSVYDDKKNSFSGFDVEMAKSLGTYLHRKIVFIKTTWSTLEQDLLAHKFDIAMGGISITKQREENFLFSDAVLLDEKCAVLLCKEKSRYRSLTDIDQPQVTVIENSGGTNERFARQYLRKANIKIYPDNNTIFTQLLNGNANVMITDAIEAHYQQKLHPELCVLELPNETVQEHKAYMLCREDYELLKQINQWLEQMRNSQEFVVLKERWL